jgi:molybdopterin-guanine dinucleotide biosynthesis protein A
MTEDTGAGFVLAGGRSSRMGVDKALVLFAAGPLIQVALETLKDAGISASIAGSRSDLSAFAETIPDTFLEAGPLGGIHAALSVSAAAWNLFLPVDMPLMPSSLLRCLLQRAVLTGAAVTATRLNGRLEPFPVVLHRTALLPIARRLETGDTACHAAWQSIPSELHSSLDAPSVEYLSQCGHCFHPAGLPPALWFSSANAPADLSRMNCEARAHES